VAIDTTHKTTKITVKRPLATCAEDHMKKLTSTGKQGWTATVTSMVKMPLPTLNITAGASRVTETLSEKTMLTSRITQNDVHGVVWWGFSVDDPNERRSGIELGPCKLPSVDFEFLADKTPPSPPPNIHIEVAAYWSWWSLPNRKWSGSKTQEQPPYHNLCQLVVLEMPSDLSASSDYMAELKVGSGMPSDREKVMLEGLVPVRPAMRLSRDPSSINLLETSKCLSIVIHCGIVIKLFQIRFV